MDLRQGVHVVSVCVCVCVCVCPCVPLQPDPDGKQTEGYSGVQVLQLNVRHMCYYRLAREAGSPWLWWDFADLFKQKCKSSTNNFTIECAQQVSTAWAHKETWLLLVPAVLGY